MEYFVCLDAAGIASPQQAPGAATPLRISVIVPVRNGCLHLARSLEALSRSAYSNFEVIVVDDCSTDNTPQIVEQYGARYLRTPQVLGPGGARNLGAEQAEGEVLAFIDADVVVPVNALSLIADDLSRDPDLAAVFGSYDDNPAWPTYISQYKNLIHHYVHQRSNEDAVTFWAGCGAIRATIFEEFGGFDAARYKVPSIEDISLGLELVRSGRRIRLDRRLKVRHLKRWTFYSLLQTDIFQRAIPWSRLILESRYLPRDLNLTYASRLSALLVGLLLGLFGLMFLALGDVVRIQPRLICSVMSLAIFLLFLLNWDLYRFLAKRRGWWFAIRSVPMHWLYFLYSGLSFVWCSISHLPDLVSASPRTVRVRTPVDRR